MKTSKTTDLLRKIDELVTGVIAEASHVVIYRLNKSQTWEKEGIEGRLFIAKRSDSPNYGFYVLNRVGEDDLAQYFDNKFEFEDKSEYLIYGNSDGIRGIWFSNPEEREKIRIEFKNICDEIRNPKPKEEKQKSIKKKEPEQKVAKAFKKVSKAVLEKDVDKEGLSKKEMQEVLLRLVKSERFIDLLHAEYKATLKQKQNKR
eukprot:maker-scaffold_18-snap-gene-6.2-mRNA-1 protein AED:0.00 eAED:0.00 QI:28/1/1/1/1/1/2/148/201